MPVAVLLSFRYLVCRLVFEVVPSFYTARRTRMLRIISCIVYSLRIYVPFVALMK